MTAEAIHRQQVRAIVSASAERGKTAFMDDLNECDGAEPHLIAEKLESILVGARPSNW